MFVAYADNSAVWLVSRPAGGSFGTPKKVANNTQVFGGVKLATDGAGDVVIAWGALYGSNDDTDPFMATVSAAGTVSYSGTPLAQPVGAPSRPRMSRSHPTPVAPRW